MSLEIAIPYEIEDDINNNADIYYSGILIYGGSNLVQTVDNYNYGGTALPVPSPLTNAPDLRPLLGNYGGPTQTMRALARLARHWRAGSVAANTFSTDQRGYPRTQNGLIVTSARWNCSRPPHNPPVLANITVPMPAWSGNGLQFTFTNAPAADFTVLTANDVSLALTNWTVLGEVQPSRAGPVSIHRPAGGHQPGALLPRAFAHRQLCDNRPSFHPTS